MEKTFIGVRDVDKEAFRKFRAKAVENKLNLGVALTKAMEKWVEEHKNGYKKGIIPKVKPFNWGKGTERTSREIDEILYK